MILALRLDGVTMIPLYLLKQSAAIVVQVDTDERVIGASLTRGTRSVVMVGL